MYTGNTNGETAKAGIKLFGATITLHGGGGGGGGGGPRQQRHQHHHRQVIKQEHERNNQVMLLQGHGESISNTITTSSGSSSDRQECHEQTETALLDDHKRAAAEKIIGCPRCRSMDTKFCYFNNYNVNQPRHFCKGCQRYWTAGGALRNVPVGAGRRKSKPPPPGHGRGAGLGVPTGFYNNDQVLLHQLELLDGVVIKEWQVAPAAFPNVLPLPAVKRRRGDPATGDQLSSNLLFPFSSPLI